MSKKPNEPDQLRTKAEMQFGRASAMNGLPRPAEEILHELQLYKVELEMQNEELRQSQVALEESRDLYVDFYDFSPVGYITLNQDAMIDEINLTGAKLLGIERKKLLHRRFAPFIAPEDRDRWYRYFLSVLKHDNRQVCEFLLKRNDGSYFFAQLHCLRLEDNGEKSAVRAVLTDITERKQSEVDLRIASVAFESQESLMITDADGVIMRVNKAFTDTTGYTAEEAVGQTPRLLQSGRHDADFYREMWEVIRRTGTWHGEVWGRRKNGESYLKWLTISAVKGVDGAITHYVGTEIDITELSNAKIAAEKANRVKSEFISSMSHELRTPLNAILGFAQLLELSSPAPTPTQMIKLKEIIRGGWYLLDLINAILDLASIESGNMSLSPECVSLQEILLECKTMMEPQAQQRNIQLNFPPLDHSLIVYADRTRVKQVLINLLSNAIKYNREHGTVEVTCSANALKHVRISVKDTGEGLPPEQFAQLFQPFNRLGQESSAVEGTGIGLVVSKKLIEQMGGNIGVESTVGAGSVFWFELPVADELQLADVRGESVTLATNVYDQSQQRTLMYIEDNPANLSLVEHIIKGRPDIRLLSAMNGNVGIEVAGAHLPDVILMDINLPGISGVDVLRILRSDPLTKHIPIIALSANAMPHDIVNTMEAGFFRYLTKPIKLNYFMNAIDEAFELAEGRSKIEAA
ncbi:hybrid sensor histidine kinase/response regulator [Candidatus Nitrotoga sp. 1052]|uniref:hybrid sensor histidine kinase/response regulator n=1 Tax=Candidatus Nitrotoga sp. 1052 TaxID=2886964 RepID=UPI001EF65CF9|nr:PAS domain-containing hybrid sensor histidine kinase/response regulator [Candidatus Nitrotoga sp. 1052]